jgi:hypothetical protein
MCVTIRLGGLVVVYVSVSYHVVLIQLFLDVLSLTFTFHCPPLVWPYDVKTRSFSGKWCIVAAELRGVVCRCFSIRVALLGCSGGFTFMISFLFLQITEPCYLHFEIMLLPLLINLIWSLELMNVVGFLI